MTNESPGRRDAIEEAAATWIVRRDGAEWTAADAAALAAWLGESSAHRVAYLRLDAAWSQAARLRATPPTQGPRVLAWAAGVLIVVVGALVAIQGGLFRSTPTLTTMAPPAQSTEVVTRPAETPAAETLAASRPSADTADAPAPGPSSPQRHITAIGDTRVVTLSDGSRVTLDTDSVIRVSFTDAARTVRLDRGQAFFEVAHDVQRPFAVEVDRVRVVAVGTAFAVRRAATDVRVVVAQGTVRLDGNAMLPAGGIAHVEGGAVQVRQVPPAEVERSLSWRSGVLTFRHTRLSEAVAEFNRYGARPVVIRDPAIASLELGGVFRFDDVEAFAHLLERTFPIDATVHPDRIELTARRSP